MGLADDSLGFGDGFLHAFLAHGFGAGAGLVDEGFRLQVGLGQDFLVALLGFGELLLHFLGIVLRLGDAAAALGENIHDRAEGVFVEEPVDDDEDDRLRDELRPCHAELAEKLFDNLHDARVRGSGPPLAGRPG